LLLGNPALQAMIEHHSLLYADLQDPLALLRGSGVETRLRKFWAYAGSSPEAMPGDSATQSYSELMSRSQPLVSESILSACDMRGFRKLLDIGGGEGSFLLAATARAPRLQGLLFDLPPVSARAAARFAGSEASYRLRSYPGDFRTDPLPEGADIVSLVRVLHDHDDATVLALLRAIRGVIPAYGRLLIAEPLRGTPGAERMGDAYFGFYLLAMGQGQPRSVAEIGGLLEQAGFGKPDELATPVPLQTRVLLSKPSSVKKH
jgi:demethylspheroidene O-methyltransferase